MQPQRWQLISYLCQGRINVKSTKNLFWTHTHNPRDFWYLAKYVPFLHTPFYKFYFWKCATYYHLHLALNHSNTNCTVLCWISIAYMKHKNSQIVILEGSILVHNWMGHSIDETRRDHISNENRYQTQPTERVETIEPLNEYVSKLHYWGYGGLNITHPNDLPRKSYTHWLLTSHIQIFWPPYHKPNKWRFRWLSHVIQGYQTGIPHHRSARKKDNHVSNKDFLVLSLQR